MKPAKLLKPVLPTEDVIVFSSPLKRALQTAQIATTGEIQINANLLERDYGPLEGKNYAENRKQAKEAGVEKPEDLPGIESLESVNSRIFCFLNELEKSVDKFEHAIVVTHSGLVGKIIRLLANQKGVMLADNIKDYNLDFIHCNNTSITRIDAQMENERVQYTIQSIADDKHLE